VDPRAAALNADDMEAALSTAVSSGEGGESFLVAALERCSGDDRVLIIAALGEAEGSKGVPLLRSLAVDHAESSESRCASLVALAKRESASASDVLRECMDDDHEDVRHYALHCLACVGDDRAWDLVYRRLQDLLSGPAPRSPGALSSRALSIQSVKLLAIGYLARHLSSVQREAAVVELMRSRRNRLYTAEGEWLKEHWPACTHDGVVPSEEPPDVSRITDWLCSPLLSPLYPRS
jgi:HEAT repeat protein